MEFARSYHAGLRKDGITPEFEHQLSIALYVCIELLQAVHRAAEAP